MNSTKDSFDTNLLIQNDTDIVRVVNISYFNNTPTFSTDIYEYQEVDMDYLVEGITEYIADTLAVDLFREYPNMSFNHFVSQEVEIWEDNLYVLGEVQAYKELDGDEIGVFNYIGRDYDSEDSPFLEVIEKYHLQKVDVFPEEVFEIMDRVKKEVDQTPMWEKNGMKQA